MCKCECKKVENVEVTDEMMAAMLGCVFGEIISDIIDGIAEEDEAEVSISQNIDLEKRLKMSYSTIRQLSCSGKMALRQ